MKITKKNAISYLSDVYNDLFDTYRKNNLWNSRKRVRYELEKELHLIQCLIKSFQRMYEED